MNPPWTRKRTLGKNLNPNREQKKLRTIPDQIIELEMVSKWIAAVEAVNRAIWGIREDEVHFSLDDDLPVLTGWPYASRMAMIG